jgi:hypothetical protein
MGCAGAGGARVEDPGEEELPEAKPRLEAAHRSLVRHASSKSSTKGGKRLEGRGGVEQHR